VLGTSQVLSRGFSFARNVIIARLISPADFGVAATFVITVTLFERLSNFGLQLFIVQDPDGESKHLQNSCHSVQIIRGLLIALIIFLFSWPISNLFHIPDALWAFQLLAIVPLLHGFNHLDMFRFQRNVRYMPKAIVETVSELVVLIAAWPLGMYFRDYSALLWLLIGKSVIFAVASHIVADRRYGLSVDFNAIKKIISFGWPLVINGLMLFGIQQGDRLIIGSNYDMTSLGLYSVAFTLTGTVSMMMANINRSLMLPLFSSVQNEKSVYLQRYKTSIHIVSSISFIILILFILYGSWLITFFYGDKYNGAAIFIIWLAAEQTMRMLRSVPTQASIAVKDTKNSMIANVSRLIALPTALFVAVSGYNLIWIPIIGFISEIFSYFISVIRLKFKQDLNLVHSMRPLVIFVPFAIVTVLFTSTGVDELDFLLITGVAVVINFLLVIVGFLTFQDSKGPRERYREFYPKILMYLKKFKIFSFIQL